MTMREADELSTFLQKLLEYQVAPALLLSEAKDIIAANESAVRLIYGTADRHVKSFDNVLIGRAVVGLNIVLTPGCKPVYRDWDAIFDATEKTAAAVAAKSRSDFDDDIPDGEEENDDAHSSRYTKDLATDTNGFWADEHQRQPPKAESDVIVLSQPPGKDAGSESGSGRESSGKSKSVRARMTLSYWDKYNTKIYLILFRKSDEIAISTLIDAKNYVGFLKPIRHESITSTFTNSEIQDISQKLDRESKPEYDLSTPEDVEIQNQLIPHIMAILSPEGQAMCFSESWYQFCGLSEEESVGSGWAAVIHPDDMKAVTESWANVIRGDAGHWTWEVRYRRADGIYIWFIIRAQPYKDKNGKTLRWYASMLDIDAWVRARLDSDRRNESMLKLLSKADVSLWGVSDDKQLHIREGHLDWDPLQVVSLVNGISTSSSPPNTLMKLANGSRKTQVAELAQVVYAALHGQEFPSAFEHEENDRHFRTRLVADSRTKHNDDQGSTTQAVLALTYEITDIKRRATLELDNERLAMNEKAAKDASSLKSSFLANMSHEIRTPIAGIIGLSEHLADLALDKEQQEFSDNIRDSAKFLLSLVNDVLDFSKIESGHMDIEAIVFAPLKLVHDIFAIMTQQASEKGLTLDLYTNLPMDTLVVGDPGRLRQILTNLIGNSIKFTEEGYVSLTIELDGADLATPKDERILDLQAENNVKDGPNANSTPTNRVNISFTVRDSGIGIDEEAMTNLFKPFSQADTSTARTHGGSGLGLMICRQLVGLMEGRIGLESAVGSGTVAMFNIPFYSYDRNLHAQEAEVMETPSPMDSPAITNMDWTSPYREQDTDDLLPPMLPNSLRRTGAPRKLLLRVASQRKLSLEERSLLFVLVVEDNAVNRKIICLSVSKLGYNVAAVGNGQEALDYLAKSSNQRRPDAILMDCMMPICDGYQATHKIRHDTELFESEVQAVPIIALTASTIKGDKERCQEAGMDDYLRKPVSRDTLERSLLKWLTAKRHQ